ncbi:SDR family NAD(P)-dependent oxidoreductase [Spiribacter halobius]|uniref:Cell-cell signaling protein n=1 Tax=Sediminicurvatus halobius TaxID=2182432 RepID=A0A2U2N5B4_9GAMM|nr:SDR family NAD(P)-dependent oxidoreductase [Spiribacter halobius]PWG64310.1 cell-cell signaling protein [Spiribacter halobius]UEX79347.1 SDR family NAD(P)-dependent oxidoreductase [Spiribacter halobius]
MNHLPDAAEVLVMGASGGIGLEFCRQLLAQPQVSRVWAGARRPDAEGLAALAEAHPDRLQTLAVDVTSEADIAAAAERIGAGTPRLHLVVNAFGLLHDEDRGIWPEKRLEDVRLESLEASFRVNAFAPILIARHLLPLLTHRERAVYASLSARVGSIGDNRLGGWYAYRAAKAAQNMFTRGLAVELGRRARQVICLALHPGTTDTPLSQPFQARVPEGKLFSTEYAVGCLLAVIDGAGREDSGRFFGWDGEEVPW